MGDDFDLFPKRENLDPFSFGSKNKAEESKQETGEEDLFGQGAGTAAPGPFEPSVPAGGEPTVDLPAPPPPSAPPSAPEASTAPPAPPVPSAPPPEPEIDVSSPLPVADNAGQDVSLEAMEDHEKGRKGPSPFILIGGTLVIILGLLYGVYTFFLKKGPEPPPAPVAVKIQPRPQAPAPPPQPAPQPLKVSPSSATPEPQPPPDATQPSAEKVTVEKPAPVARKAPAETTPQPPAPPEPPAPPPVAVASGGYSVQAGALVLKSSVRELVQQLESMGYDPRFRKGSTTAMMTMLSAGPFSTVQQARAAMERMRNAGVEVSLRRKSNGGAMVNAGSYLLEGNARSITRKIRSLGYPVQSSHRETKLDMTMVRVGRYDTKEEASRVRDELKSKGLDAIVVKLQ